VLGFGDDVPAFMLVAARPRDRHHDAAVEDAQEG
jgi:hypothetical protein